MTALLAKIQGGEALKPETTRLLLELMRGCRTGDARLRAGLPAGVPIANRTGQLGRSTNDFGLIRLPDGTHLAVAVFIRSSDVAVPQRERAIAEVARTVYNHFAGSRATAAAR
jgi:beta-lactamase class A